MTQTKTVPATTTETEVAFQIMRASLTTLVMARKSKHIRIPFTQRHKAYGGYLRMQMGEDGAIDLWLEEPPAKARQGVVYSTVPRR